MKKWRAATGLCDPLHAYFRANLAGYEMFCYVKERFLHNYLGQGCVKFSNYISH